MQLIWNYVWNILYIILFVTLYPLSVLVNAFFHSEMLLHSRCKLARIDYFAIANDTSTNDSVLH